MDLNGTCCRESVLGNDGAAVVGGINMMLMAYSTYMFKKAGMLSADGRCKALDQAADGYVRSEVSWLLHPLLPSMIPKFGCSREHSPSLHSLKVLII